MTATTATYVKVYGLQRSGTNWLKFLVEQNFEAVIAVDLPLGNKHEAPRPFEAIEEWRRLEERPIDDARLPYALEALDEALAEGEVRAVAIVKPLLAWIESFFRYRRLKEPDRYSTLTPRMVEQWTERWVTVNAAYAALPVFGWRCALVDYGELLLDLDGGMQRLQRDLQLERRDSTRWVSSDRAMKRSTDEMHHGELVSESPFERDRYASRRYLDELGPAVRDAAASVLAGLELPPVLEPLADVRSERDAQASER